MGAVSTLAALPLQIKGAIRTALNNLAGSVDAKMEYKGTGDALPANPMTGWVFKVNATSAALPAAPAGAGNGDFILWNGTAWEIMVDVS